MAVSKAISIQEMTSFMQSGMTYDQVNSMIQGKYQTGRGFSPRRIRRFCQINNLSRNCKLSRKDIRTKIYQCVSEIF